MNKAKKEALLWKLQCRFWWIQKALLWVILIPTMLVCCAFLACILMDSTGMRDVEWLHHWSADIAVVGFLLLRLFSWLWPDAWEEVTDAFKG